MKTLTKEQISKSRDKQSLPTKEELMKREERTEQQKNDGEGDLSIDIRQVEGEVYTGTDGNDTFNFLGMYGDDTMIGTEGADYFDGGQGNDTVDYSDSPEGVFVDLAEGRGWYGGHAAGDTLINVENVIGSDGDDVFVGSEADNTFEGRGGYDIFHADVGADTYYGGADGNKLVAVGDDMTIDLALGQGSGGVVDGDRYFDIADVSIGGNNNMVIGTQGDNTIAVSGLDNTVSMLDGNDTLAVGFDSALGNSTFDGGSGVDTLDLSNVQPSSIDIGLAVDLTNQTFQQFRLSDGSTVGEISEITNFENVVGSNLKDVITDNKEDNTFTGNGGADVFRFIHAEGGQNDTITDFTSGIDRIDLSNIDGMGALTGFDGQGDVEFGEFKIPIEDAVDMLTEIRDKVGLPSGISFAYQDGDDVVIYTDFAAGNSITLEDVDIQTMSYDDFIL
jgi:Ca2+-binding RTX toxin-like protein